MATKKMRLSDYRKKIKQIGNWSGVRWLRNQNIPFEVAYYIMFNRLPRR
jgi:hypothetical protein